MMLDGLKRIIGSAKVQLLTSAAFGAVVTYLLTPGSADNKRGLLEAMIYALAALVGAVILGWSHEDAAAKSSPSQQVNVQSDVKNPPAEPTAPAQPAPQPQPFTTAQMEALQQAFAAMLAPHLKPKVTPPPPPAQE